MQQVLPIISVALFVVYAALIIYYAIGWRSISGFRLPTSNFKSATRISIIIPARNEEQNIETCLHAIISQSYPKELFEVMVVDDHSTDNTAQKVCAFAQPNIKLIPLKDFVTDETNSYKKKAIEVAIAQSTGELIVTTDADCTAPLNWLQTIAAFYEEEKPSLIVMPVTINCSNKFIEIFQALDFMTLQGITGAAVSKKALSMCNGANLAYTKKAFEAVNGFTGIDAIASGDDMLLMHKIYKQDKTAVAYLKSKDVIVQTEPVHSVGAFFNQRIRWASKAGKYDDKRIFGVLLLVYLFNVILLLLPIIASFKNIQYTIFNFQFSIFKIWLWLLLLKTIVELLFLFPVARLFNKQILLWFFPLMQPFHIIYTVIAGWFGSFGKYQWKGRTVK